jgi:hypothetical protein
MNTETRTRFSAVSLIAAVTILVTTVVTIVGGCASSGGGTGGGSERDIVTTAYQENAGSSRERVVFPGLDGWRTLSGDNIVVRTRFNDYFLLTLEPACASDLTFSSSLNLAIAQRTRNTLSRFDTVSAGDSACRIQYIREVDHRAVAEDLQRRDIEESFIRLNRDR